jgi:hypothetical protein
MDPITIIEGEELEQLIEALTYRKPYALRIHQSRDGVVKWKVGGGTWTYWKGRDDTTRSV